jgi:hypothetical protein
MEDIVDDNVLPKLSLAVDGLNLPGDGNLDIAANDVPARPPINPSTHMPSTNFNPEQLEVYGWESSFWKKFCGYLGF